MKSAVDFFAIQSGENRLNYGIRIGGVLAQTARKRGGKETWVYFIQEEDNGPVKVGIAGNPGSRLRELQVGNPMRLTIRSAFKAPASLEKLIHETFAEDRMVGEWFAPSEQLLALADALRHFTVTKVTYYIDEMSWAGPLRDLEAAA